MRDLRNTSWISRFGATRRLGTALVVAVVAFLVQPDSISWHTRAGASWDLGTLAYLGLAWMLIGWTDARVTRHHALSQDQSGYVMFLFNASFALAGDGGIELARIERGGIRAWMTTETILSGAT